MDKKIQEEAGRLFSLILSAAFHNEDEVLLDTFMKLEDDELAHVCIGAIAVIDDLIRNLAQVVEVPPEQILQQICIKFNELEISI